MSMKRYNHALDFTVLALASAANGNFENAGRLLVKASKAKDVKAAVAILEASNAQAFDAERQAVKASKLKTSTAKVKAGARVKAATQVKAFDIGDEDVTDLIEGPDDEEVEEIEEVDAADEDEDDESVDIDNVFASVLKGMNGKRK